MCRWVIQSSSWSVNFVSKLNFTSRLCIRVGHSDSRFQLWDSGNGCVDALQEQWCNSQHNGSTSCFYTIRTLKIHCIFCGRWMEGLVRLMSRRKQWIGLTIPVVMKNSERAMILLTVALMIPLLCGITFPCWTTCHWGWRTDPSNPFCLKGSFSTVLPDSSDGKLGYYNFALCGRWHTDCGYPMSPLSLLLS